MKKKILFINRYFHVGGIQSSMINMANELCEEYDVDILAFYPEGVLKAGLDPRVNVLKPSWPLLAMGLSPKEALKTKNPLVFLFRALGSLWAKIFNNAFPIYLATQIQPKLKGYDLAIAYRAETRKNVLTSGYVRILDRCVEAKTKAVWIHYDANHLNASAAFNERYYQKIDKIVGVSQSVAKAFEGVNPTLSSKMDYCYHFLNYKKLYENSEKTQAIPYPENKFICFSACRLSDEKGIPRGISAIAPTLKNHDDIVWYIAGDGPASQSIEDAIKENDLDGRIILLGNQSNPYPYMKNCDLLLSLSYHETGPMVCLEAKSLHVPCFVTETLSSYEILQDGVDSFVCENSEEGIRKSFAELMNNRQRIYEAKKNLEDYKGDNKIPLAKISEWIE